jgi:hypothetical protein
MISRVSPGVRRACGPRVVFAPLGPGQIVRFRSVIGAGIGHGIVQIAGVKIVPPVVMVGDVARRTAQGVAVQQARARKRSFWAGEKPQIVETDGKAQVQGPRSGRPRFQAPRPYRLRRSLRTRCPESSAQPGVRKRRRVLGSGPRSMRSPSQNSRVSEASGRGPFNRPAIS